MRTECEGVVEFVSCETLSAIERKEPPGGKMPGGSCLERVGQRKYTA